MSKVLIFGGTPFSLINFRGDLIKLLKKNGHNVHCLSGKDQTFDEIKFQELQFEYHSVFLRRANTNIFLELYSFFLIFFKIRSIRPDIIFSYSIKPVIYGTLASKLLGLNNCYSLISGVGYIFTSYKKSNTNLMYIALKFLYKNALKFSNTIFFQNNDDIQLFRELGLIEPFYKVQRLYGSGVNLAKFKFKPLNTDKVTFLMVARLLKDKGVWEYLEAAKRIKANYPQTSFVLVGDVDDNPTSITNAELAHITGKDFIRYMSYSENIADLIGDSTVCVLPSYREGAPRFLLEALSVGRPIVTTNTPGCRDIVEEGWNGFLVDVASSASLAAALERCIENKDALEVFGRNSRKLAEEYYNVEHVNRKILKAMKL